jgi:hypothetical protein
MVGWNVLSERAVSLSSVFMIPSPRGEAGRRERQRGRPMGNNKNAWRTRAQTPVSPSRIPPPRTGGELALVTTAQAPMTAPSPIVTPGLS